MLCVTSLLMWNQSVLPYCICSIFICVYILHEDNEMEQWRCESRRVRQKTVQKNSGTGFLVWCIAFQLNMMWANL